jgi:isopenicillin-N epimerase
MDPGASVFVDQIERLGTRDPSALLSVPDAIAFQAERDWPTVREECHALVRMARCGIAEITGIEPFVADDARWFGQMAAMPLPPCDGAALKRRLYDEHRIEIPVPSWGETACLRISAQGYTTRADVEHLLSAVETLLPSVRCA